MSNPRNDDPHSSPRADASASTYGDDRWQGPSFAASWISPPGPRPAFDDGAGFDPRAPHREDDHA